MTQGIYITANDQVMEQAIALLKSLRCYDPYTPVVLIPYDDQYQGVAEALRKYGVTVYPDLAFLKHLSQQLYDIFGAGFFDKPNKFRKHACWFGEFERFLYIDTDIIVFEKIINSLNYLQEYLHIVLHNLFFYLPAYHIFCLPLYTCCIRYLQAS